MGRSVRDDGIDAACEELGKLYDAGDREALLQTIRHLLSATLNDVDALSGRVADAVAERKSERIDVNQLFLASGELSQGQMSQAPAEEPKPAPETETKARRQQTTVTAVTAGGIRCRRIYRAKRSACIRPRSSSQLPAAACARSGPTRTARSSPRLRR